MMVLKITMICYNPHNSKIDKKMTAEDYFILGRKLTKHSFFVGIYILLGYLILNWVEFIFIGLGYIVLASVVNIVILIPILIKALSERVHRRKLLLTAGLILLNIPAAILCCYFGMIGRGIFRFFFSLFKNIILHQ